MNDKQRKLVEDNIGLVYHTLKKMNIYQNHKDYDDLVQEGTLGLMKAAENFNSELDVKFATYAVPNISGYIYGYFRDFSERKISMSRLDYYTAKKFLKTKDYEVTCKEHNVTKEKVDECVVAYNSISGIDSLQREISDNIGNSATLESLLIVDGPDTYESVIDKCDLLNSIEMLDEMQKKAVYLFYIKEYNQNQTAKIMGVSQVQVSRILSKSKKLIKDTITKGHSTNDKRVKHLVTYNNKTLQIEEWSKITGIKYHTIISRINKGWDLDKVFHNREWDKEVV